jgi:uncharacterized protein YfaS (alpha-2-macroglobulin family)
VTGAVTVMAVDEAICMLTAVCHAGPARAFLAQRGWGSFAFDLYRELMPVLDDAVAGVSHIGGDGGGRVAAAAESHQGQSLQAGGPVAGRGAAGRGGACVGETARAGIQGELRLMAVAYNGRINPAWPISR